MTKAARISRITARPFIFLFISIISFSSATCPSRGWADPNQANPVHTAPTSESDRARINFKDEYENIVKDMQAAATPIASPPNGGRAVSPDSGQSPAENPEPAPEKSLTILFRGDEGVPFPAATDVVLKVATSAELESTRPTPWPTPTPWSKPGRCEKNETSLVELTADGDDQEVRYDLLFLPEHLVPLQPEEVFGQQVTLYPYGEKSGVSGELWQKVHEVPCVPFRVRLTARGYRHDLGRNALKNYSNGQSGHGEFHPWISEQLFGSTKTVAKYR